VLIPALLFGLLCAQAASAGEPPYPAFAAPNARRWKEVEWSNRRYCNLEADQGDVWCEYGPRGFRRRLTNFWADPLGTMKVIRIRLGVMPSTCAVADAEPEARLALHRIHASERRGETLVIERPSLHRLIGRSPSLRLALASSGTDVVYARLDVPTGVTEEDEADFTALLDSIMPVDGPFQHLRRGRWLLRRPSFKYVEVASRCGLADEPRLARAREELLRAVDVDPADWRPYALLGEEAERRGGGPKVGHVAAHGRYAAFLDGFSPDEVMPRDAGPPLDRAALREAIAWYDAALRRDPPVQVGEQSPRFPEDRTLILVQRARAELLLGAIDAAQRTYREAFDLGVRPSWGYFQAAFMLAAHADSRGDPDAAFPLYRAASLGYAAHMGTHIIWESEGGPLVTESDRRLAQIRQARRAAGARGR
jgi:tetratricopeptide (TPR) repeat protein